MRVSPVRKPCVWLMNLLLCWALGGGPLLMLQTLQWLRAPEPAAVCPQLPEAGCDFGLLLLWRNQSAVVATGAVVVLLLGMCIGSCATQWLWSTRAARGVDIEGSSGSVPAPGGDRAGVVPAPGAGGERTGVAPAPGGDRAYRPGLDELAAAGPVHAGIAGTAAAAPAAVPLGDIPLPRHPVAVVGGDPPPPAPLGRVITHLVVTPSGLHAHADDGTLGSCNAQHGRRLTLCRHCLPNAKIFLAEAGFGPRATD